MVAARALGEKVAARALGEKVAAGPARAAMAEDAEMVAKMVVTVAMAVATTP